MDTTQYQPQPLRARDNNAETPLVMDQVVTAETKQGKKVQVAVCSVEWINDKAMGVNGYRVITRSNRRVQQTYAMPRFYLVPR